MTALKKNQRAYFLDITRKKHFGKLVEKRTGTMSEFWEFRPDGGKVTHTIHESQLFAA